MYVNGRTDKGTVWCVLSVRYGNLLKYPYFLHYLVIKMWSSSTQALTFNPRTQFKSSVSTECTHCTFIALMKEVSKTNRLMITGQMSVFSIQSLKPLQWDRNYKMFCRIFKSFSLIGQHWLSHIPRMSQVNSSLETIRGPLHKADHLCLRSFSSRFTSAFRFIVLLKPWTSNEPQLADSNHNIIV